MAEAAVVEAPSKSLTPTLDAYGYDSTGYISKMGLDNFTIPLKDIPAVDLGSKVMQYAQEREAIRDQRLEAQTLKAYEGLDQAQKDQFDDLYDFYGRKHVLNKGQFFRDMFDLSGRLSNEGVKEGMLSKLESYSDKKAFDNDATRLGFGYNNDAGMMFGWGDPSQDISAYNNSRTGKAKLAEQQRLADEAMRARYTNILQGMSDGGSSSYGFGREAHDAWGRMAASDEDARQRASNPFGMNDYEMSQQAEMARSEGIGSSRGGGASSSGARGSMGAGSSNGESKGRGLGGR